MTVQTIPEYLEEERKKLQTLSDEREREAARIHPLQHGHHRTAKQPQGESLPPIRAATNKMKRKTAAVARKKPRASGIRAAKTRKRA